MSLAWIVSNSEAPAKDVLLKTLYSRILKDLKSIRESRIILASEAYFTCSTQSSGVDAFYGIKISNFVTKIFSFKVTAHLDFV